MNTVIAGITFTLDGPYGRETRGLLICQRESGTFFSILEYDYGREVYTARGVTAEKVIAAGIKSMAKAGWTPGEVEYA